MKLMCWVKLKKMIRRQGYPNFFDSRTLCETCVPQTNDEIKRIENRLKAVTARSAGKREPTMLYESWWLGINHQKNAFLTSQLFSSNHLSLPPGVWQDQFSRAWKRTSPSLDDITSVNALLLHPTGCYGWSKEQRASIRQVLTARA